MAITQEVIPNFIGGVSQQPDKLKYPNQAKELLNMNPDPTIGLSKRKPTEHIGRLMDVLPIQPKVYTDIRNTEGHQKPPWGAAVGIQLLRQGNSHKRVSGVDDQLCQDHFQDRAGRHHHGYACHLSGRRHIRHGNEQGLQKA